MMGWIVRRIGWARIIAFALVLFALTVRVVDPIPVQIVRNLTFDVFQQIAPRESQPFPVAIIDVDDASLAEIGQWPWPRTRFAEMIDNATRDGAVALAFDIIFSERDRLSPGQIAGDNPDLPENLRDALAGLPDNDDALSQAMARSRVILGQTSVRTAKAGQESDGEIPQVPHARVGLDPMPFLMKFPNLVENLPELEKVAAGRGVFNVRPDPDGVYRRTPIVVSVENRVRLGLAPELLRIATGGKPFAIRTNEAGIDGVVLAGKLVRTAQDGTVRPYLTPSLPSRFVSAADVITGRMQKGRLTGHLVLVGTSAIGLEDYRTTSLGTQMPGVEIHAQLLENILSDSLLKRPNYAIAIELVAAFAMCLLLIILTPIMNATFLIVSALMFLSSFGWASYILFTTKRMLIDPSFPILAGLATIMFMSAANYLREERRRQQIRNAFGQYVSRDLVDELSESQDRLKLGGENRELTLLFSDVRGFTAIAEGYRDDPGGLTALMNRFLNLMSNAILEHGGTIDKFMGDAVMAFWNAPLDHEDHARAACAAALEMVVAVDRLNRERDAEAAAENRDFQSIEIGIGLNTGACTVGNMGSDIRFDYTAMGDPVNLASRLEGQTRNYGVSIVAGSSTEAAVHNDFALIELDLIRVKGKNQPEHIFALLGGAKLREDSLFADLAMLNAAMLSAYRDTNWDQAETLLDEMEPIGLEIDHRLAGYFQVYRDRIVQMRRTPPPDDWTGIYDATSK